MPFHIVVKLAGIFAKEAQHREIVSPELTELSAVQKSLGIVLKPVHPGSDDPNLAPYFMIDVPDPAIGEKVLDRLRLCKAVDGAYLKPSDALPGAEN
jgi:hypothetical protein